MHKVLNADDEQDLLQRVEMLVKNQAPHMGIKAGTDNDAKHEAQKKRAKECGIGIKDGGNLSCPSEFESIADKMDFWGDYTNYAYPLIDKEHADNAAARFGAPDALAVYTAKEQDIIAKRIMKRQESFGEKPDWWPPKEDSGKGANVTRRMRRAAAGEKPVKALDFNAALQQVSADDQLQDDWGDSFQAFVNAMHSVMCQAVYGAGMGDEFDGQDAAETVLEQFSAHMSDLVKQSLAASFVPMLDDDGDSFLDPDGPNADDDDSYGMMSATTARSQKSGRTLSADNHAMMTKALGMIGMGHKALSEFVKSNAPDNATAADPAPKNPGDEPPSASDNVYDPAFGKSAHQPAASTASPYSQRAGAPAQSFTFRPAVATPALAAGAGTLGSASTGDVKGAATATTLTADDLTTEDIASFRALLAQMRATTAPSPVGQPVAAQ